MRLLWRAADTRAPPAAMAMATRRAEKLCRDPEQRHRRLPWGHTEERLDPMPPGPASQGARIQCGPAKPTPLGTGMRRGFSLSAGLWSGLTRFLGDPRIPLDNQRHRGLRGVVVSLKNLTLQRGTEAAALFCSMIEPAKLCGGTQKRTCSRRCARSSSRPEPSRFHTRCAADGAGPSAAIADGRLSGQSARLLSSAQ
jgi:hypothetical protein